MINNDMPAHQIIIRRSPVPIRLPWLALCLCVFALMLCGCSCPQKQQKSSSPFIQQNRNRASSTIQEAFALGIAELEKDGAPLGQDYRISIEPNGDDWKMRYSQIPQKMSGDRLLIIRGRHVQVIPLF